MLIPACASPQFSLPYAANPEIVTHMRHLMLHRPSIELKPAMPAGLCQCGCQYRYVIANEACDVYCTEPHLGCKLRLSRRQCALNHPECTFVKKIASFVSVTIHAWRCACYIRLKSNIQKMANQFQHFRDTFFLVYKFHWFGHTASSGTYSYNLTQHPAYADLNSQIAEQFKSASA